MKKKEENGTNTGDEEEEEDEDDDVKHLPIDKGWAWVVAFAAMMNATLMIGYLICLGILFLEFLEIFQASTASTTLIFGITAVVFAFSSFVTMQVLLNRFSERQIICTGGVLVATGILLSVFADSLVFLICTQSLFVGVGQSMIIGPGLVAVTKYFRKRRAFAVSLSNSGVSLAIVLFPMLCRFLLDAYGLRGALLVFTSIELNIVVFGLLIRPLRLPGNREADDNLSQNDDGGQTTRLLLKEKLNGSALSVLNVTGSAVNITGSAQNGSAQNINGNSKNINGSAYNVNGNTNINGSAYNVNNKGIAMNINGSGQKLNGSVHSLTTSNNSPKLEAKQNGHPDNVTSNLLEIPINERKRHVTRTTSYRSDVQSMTSIIGSMTSVVAIGTATHRPKMHVLEDIKTVIKSLDFRLLKRPLFGFIVLTSTFGVPIYIYNQYLPAILAEFGGDESDVPVFMAVIGSVDFASRILTGYVADLNYFRIPSVMISSIFISGLNCHLMTFYRSYVTQFVCVVIFGVFANLYGTFLPVLCTSLLGVENLPNAIGFFTIIHGSMISLIHPLIGFLKDFTGSYVTSYHFLGTIAMLSALILLAEPLFKRLDDRTLKREMTSSEVEENV